MLEISWIEPEIANEGLHNCTITWIEDLGMCANQFRTERRVRFVFRMDDQKDIEGKHVEVWEQFPFKIHPQAKLGKFLRDLGLNIPSNTKFDLNNIVGRKLQVVVEHRKDELTGRTYANIATVIKPRPRVVTPVVRSEAI
jgi:hypothetical protein